ncbi:DNA primase [Lysinibacillus sp. TE18511]
MEQTISIEKRIQEVLANDPLFQVIQETPAEQHFLSESYLDELIEKKYYSTPEVAGWFEVTDAQLRYYIKPFEEYLFDGAATNPSTSTIIRLDFKAILKLRMILLLKDEYRVKGLKRLLCINEDGHVIKQTTSEVTAPKDLEGRMDTLSQALAQIMQTGLFQIEQDETTQQTQLILNEDLLQQKFKAIPPETSQKIADIQVVTEQLQKENQELKEKIDEVISSNKNDIAIRIREKHLEQTILNRLQNEALKRYAAEKKGKLFGKLFRSTQIEIEKKQFITDYIEEHFSKQLTQALHEYHEHLVE